MIVLVTQLALATALAAASGDKSEKESVMVLVARLALATASAAASGSISEMGSVEMLVTQSAEASYVQPAASWDVPPA